MPVAIAAAAAAVMAATAMYNAYQSYKNYKYQKSLQNTMFQREDTSIYRRVEDLRASGLSPVLAAGQGAQAGPVVSTQAPQMDQSMAMNMMQMAAMQAEIGRTTEQAKLAKAQTTQALAAANKSNVDAAESSWNLHKYRDQYNLPTNSSSWGKLIGDIYGQTQGGPVGSALNKLKNQVGPSKTTEQQKIEAKAKAMEGLTPEQKREFERRLMQVPSK